MPRSKLARAAVLVAAALIALLYAIPADSVTEDATDNGEVEHEVLNAQPLSSTGSCGVERWAVKTGTDADAGLINLNATTATTISYLRGLPQPSTLPANNRIKPTETTVFQLQTTLVEYKLETDSDYHLVVKDSSGNTMIVEIPDPACVGASSPLLPGIRNARAEFDAKYNATTSFQTANVPVTVTGVGFFDFLHGQTGVAPNGIELHAILDIKFGTGGGGTGCTAGQLLGNPGFETGSASPWTATSGVVNNSSAEPPHSGSWDAWLDGYGSTTTDVVSQTVSLPTGCSSYTFSFWLHVDTAETSTTTAYDTLSVQVLNSSGSVLGTLATYSNLNHNTGYAQKSFSLAGYAGQTVTLRFTGAEDYTAQTSFVLDDAAVTVS
jgi:hypothetical protein